MKTTEENKQEVVNYLTKTSQHTFKYEDGSLYKVIKNEGKFFVIDGRPNSYHKVREINIDQHILYHGGNSKCVLKHSLFLGKKLKSVKTNKYTNEIIKSIYDNAQTPNISKIKGILEKIKIC